jgi:hypothetical protein
MGADEACEFVKGRVGAHPPQEMAVASVGGEGAEQSRAEPSRGEWEGRLVSRGAGKGDSGM